MTHQTDGEQIKIKETVLIKLSNRSIDKKIKFTKWINAQSNTQNSILSLIEHAIDRYGFVDITEHEIAKKMHLEMLHFQSAENAPVIVQKSPTEQSSDAPEQKEEKFASEHLKAPERKVTKNDKIDTGAF